MHQKAQQMKEDKDYLNVPVVDHNWVLNTPERKGILSDGPPKHANCNILGKGAYGTVFKATYRNRQVAVKVVKNRPVVNSTENETYILGWKHKNIVRILKVESTNKFGIIIMEHFPGQSLQTILDSMALPLPHRVLISLDILCALSFCHKHGLLHLDLKPQNVLIAFAKAGFHASNEEQASKNSFKRNYICKLCDFGSSIRLNDQKAFKMHTRGTVRYMSPEALRAGLLSTAADIYSLGITMWQLKQRRAPYDGIQCNEVVAFQVVKNNLRPNSDLSRFVPTNLSTSSPKERQKSCNCVNYKTQSSSFFRAKKELNFGAFDKMKISPRGCYSAGKNNSGLNVSISPISRFKKSSYALSFNGPTSAVRNLGKELDFIDCGRIDSDLSFNIKKEFEDNTNWECGIRQRKENEFSTIFQACWRSSPEKRPITAVLCKQLKGVLI